MKFQKANLLYKFIIFSVKLTSKITFGKVYLNYIRKEKNLLVDHPTVIFANHVTEEDIMGLSYVFEKVKPMCKFHFAMRQDIVEPNFLVKEFSPKGFMKFILHLIDKSQIIKILLLYIGGIGVKRAFRDDARKLLKDGELRNIVDSQWEELAMGCKNGRNLFLFPEGKFSDDGFINSIRRGVFILNSKIPNLKCTFVNFTYDFISSKKMELHIVFGDSIDIQNIKDEKEISELIKNKLGKNFTITSANFFSFILYQEILKNGIELEKLKSISKNFLEKIKSHKNPFFISEKLIHSFDSEFNNFFAICIDKKFIKLESNFITLTDKIEIKNFKHGADLIKKNPYLYHFNQLRLNLEELNLIFKSI